MAKNEKEVGGTRKVLVENTRECPIDLTVDGVVVTIPASKMESLTPDSPQEKVNGWAEVDADHLDAVMRHACVVHYFDAGWLINSGDVIEEAV